MRHLTREDVRVQRLLRSARTIAVIAPSRRDARGLQTVDYLRRAGYDVVPIRRDRAEIAGMRSIQSLIDVPGQVDLALVVGRRWDVPETISAAARKRVEAVWLMPGVRPDGVDEEARRHRIPLVRDRDVIEDHRTLWSVVEPRKLGVHVSRRKNAYEDDRKTRPTGGYREAGGGGRAGGGGGRSTLDEKKMVAGRPSRRRGPMRPRRSA